MEQWTQGQLEALLQAERELRLGLTARAPQATAADLVDLLKQAKAAGLALKGDDLRVLLAEFGSLTQRGAALANDISGAESVGLWVRAAARAGLLAGVQEAEVSNLPARQVRALYAEVEAAFVEATTVPKN